MTDYLNPHRIYPDNISRRIDIAPGFDSDRTPKEPLVVPTVKESLTTADCLFCKELRDYKDIQLRQEFAYEYTAAIVSRLYKAGNPRARSTSTNYGNSKYVLNFCPMCGRKLEVEG